MTEPETPPPDQTDRDDDAIRQQFRELGIKTSRRGTRSSLLRWLEQMYDTLGPEHGRITDWQPACEAAVAAGVRGGNGQLPTPRLLASQWRKIKRRRMAAGLSPGNVDAEAAAVSLAVAPPEVSDPVRPPPPTSWQADRDTPSELACRYRTLPPPKAPVVITEEMRREGEAKAARVLAELSAMSHRRYGA